MRPDRFAFLALALACAAPASAETWTEIQRLENGLVVSYDRDSVVRTGDVVRVRVQLDLRATDQGDYAVHVGHEEMDCRARTRRRLGLASIGRDGSRVADDEVQPVMPLAPGSLLSRLFETVCAIR